MPPGLRGNKGREVAVKRIKESHLLLARLFGRDRQPEHLCAAWSNTLDEHFETGPCG